MYYDFANSKFVRANGFGSKITLTTHGEPIVALENGEIYFAKRKEMLKVNGTARELSMSSTDDLWMISNVKESGGY